MKLRGVDSGQSCCRALCFGAGGKRALKQSFPPGIRGAGVDVRPIFAVCLESTCYRWAALIVPIGEPVGSRQSGRLPGLLARSSSFRLQNRLIASIRPVPDARGRPRLRGTAGGGDGSPTRSDLMPRDVRSSLINNVVCRDLIDLSDVDLTSI